jgi:hypothetical protein
VLPDPDGPGRRATIDRALEGEAAALGPSVAPAQAHRSLRWARLTLELSLEGALPAGPPVRTAEHLATLTAWLAHQRHTPGIHIHPQTVRYRVAKLRELVGDALETPQGRFELQLALRVSG